MSKQKNLEANSVGTHIFVTYAFFIQGVKEMTGDFWELGKFVKVTSDVYLFLKLNIGIRFFVNALLFLDRFWQLKQIYWVHA